MVWLYDLYHFNLQAKSDFSEWNKLPIGNFKDSMENSYARVIDCNINYNWLYTDYLLSKKYSRISGKFALSYYSNSTDYKATLNLYGDNKLLYTSPELTKGILPIDFDVNISGVEKLKIEINTDIPSTASTFVRYGLVDVALHK